MGTLSAIAIAKMIYALPVSKKEKTRISMCVFYNIKQKDQVNLYKRFLKCKRAP